MSADQRRPRSGSSPASALELFTIGIGPSSSHTVGPMRAAATVAARLEGRPLAALRVSLFGSLAATCSGHGTDRAVLAGLAGCQPETVDPAHLRSLGSPAAVAVGPHLLPWERFTLSLESRGGPPGHPNALCFSATDRDGGRLLEAVFRSVGGGFITEDGVAPIARPPAPAPYVTAAELVQRATELGGLAAVASRNESAWRPAEATAEGLRSVAGAMEESIERGLQDDGVLPGGLGVRRRAPGLRRALAGAGHEPAQALEWVAAWAIAVNEENAAGGRVVTAPTNGAAGVLPSVIRFARVFEGIEEPDVVRMLLAAAAVGGVIKDRASISGAEVGCQGEVGSAAAMAAAALAEVLGGSPDQVANAAEIALEHHLGMTCDPVAGLVQVPCIERNAMGATKAIAAAKLALRGDGRHVVSLDSAIDAMRRTGEDMKDAYKETALGGLAVSVPEC